MNEAKNLKLVVATFADETGAARALATIVPGVGPERIGQAAIVSKEYEGKIRFHETAHTSVAEGAAEGAGHRGLRRPAGLPRHAARAARAPDRRGRRRPRREAARHGLRGRGPEGHGAGPRRRTIRARRDDGPGRHVEEAERLLGEAGAVNMAVKEVLRPPGRSAGRTRRRGGLLDGAHQPPRLAENGARRRVRVDGPGLGPGVRARRQPRRDLRSRVGGALPGRAPRQDPRAPRSRARADSGSR